MLATRNDDPSAPPPKKKKLMAKDGGGERSEWRLKCKTEGSEWLSEGAEGGSVVEACDNDAQIRGDLYSLKQESPHNTISISSLPLSLSLLHTYVI